MSKITQLPSSRVWKCYPIDKETEIKMDKRKRERGGGEEYHFIGVSSDVQTVESTPSLSIVKRRRKRDKIDTSLSLKKFSPNLLLLRWISLRNLDASKSRQIFSFPFRLSSDEINSVNYLSISRLSEKISFSIRVYIFHTSSILEHSAMTMHLV